MPHLLQVKLELVAGPYQVTGQFGVLASSLPPLLLDGHIAEVPGAGVGRAEMGQQGAGVQVVQCWCGGHSRMQFVQGEGLGAEAHIAVPVEPYG